MPSVHMSVVPGVVLFMQAVCVGTLSCCSVCIYWTVVRIDRRGSMSACCILYGGELGLICMGWNVPAIIGKVGVLIKHLLCVPTLYGFVRK